MNFVQGMACAAVVLASAEAAHAAPSGGWTLHVLPTLTENGGSARAVNNRGDIAGTSRPAENFVHPVTWSSGAITDLLEGNPATGVANAINDRGMIAGTQGAGVMVWDNGAATSLGIAGEPRTDHAVVWENGVLRDMGTVGGAYSYAIDVTNHGMVVGWSEAGDGSIWMFTAGTTGPLKPVLYDAIPSAVNDHGQIVGSLRNGMAFLYENDTIADLSAVARTQGGWTSFHPFDISDRGWIAGIGYREGSTYQGTPLLLVPDTGKGK